MTIVEIMGTNYYLTTSAKPCPTCGHDPEAKRRHIGKSSAGWCFALHVIPEDGINDLADWEREWSKPNAYIEDEYKARLAPEQMKAKITERSWDTDWSKPAPNGYDSWEEFHRMNHSEPGLHGLLRARVDNRHCIGHGAGTWDLITGDFS